jgi:anti-anti-sigma factor
MAGVSEVSAPESDGKPVVVRWRGSHDALEADLTEVSASLDTRVVVDLEGAEAVDSRTLTTLHRVARRMRSGGGRLTVVASDPRLSSILRLTMLDRSFDVVRSRAEIELEPRNP